MSRFETNRLLRGAAQGFTLRKDAFSVQISLRGDPLFWVRIDTERNGRVVSDLNPGKASARVTAEGLEFALYAAGFNGVAPITVSDVIPSRVNPQQQLDGLREIFGAYARMHGKFVCAFSTTERRGKTDLCVEFD